MNIVVLEGKDLISELRAHQILKDKLELPDYYGKNLNALWDCLTGWVSLPLKIVWNDYQYSRSQLGDFADELMKLFLEAQDEIKGFEIEIR
jgi:ribonuclease inhibitor